MARFRTLETTFVELADRATTCPVHRARIVPLLRVAAEQLECEPHMRCICREAHCLINQIVVRAWHLYWAWERDVGMLQKTADGWTARPEYVDWCPGDAAYGLAALHNPRAEAA